AARLAAERYLDEALGMAASADTESAPASVRQALLQAFDNSKVRAREGRVSSARPKWLAATTATAAAALLTLVFLMSLRISGRRSAGQAPLPHPAPETPLRADAQDLTTTPGTQARQHSGGGKRSKRQQKLARPARKATDDSAMTAALSPAWSDSYALTDFIPLTHLSSSTAIASGQVIRVKVPLSAFLSLGLLVSPEHADELVNAELVVGDDGVQRAIRLGRWRGALDQALWRKMASCVLPAPPPALAGIARGFG